MLEAVVEGDRHATDELFSVAHEELKRLASGHVASESPNALHSTALVHEVT